MCQEHAPRWQCRLPSDTLSLGGSRPCSSPSPRTLSNTGTGEETDRGHAAGPAWAAQREFEREEARHEEIKINPSRIFPTPSHYAVGRSQEGILLISCPR